jgi:ATP-dependent exoDNAse (exonuclease V) beta subunit
MPSTNTATNPKGITITFTEEDHKYVSILPDNTEIVYTSGTTFLNEFFIPFDPDGKIAARCAKKEGISVEQLQEKWKKAGLEATAFGTKIHETIEDTILQQPYRNKPNSLKEADAFLNAKRIGKKLLEKLDIVGVETIVFDHKLKIAGTIDLLAKSKTEENLYYIIDHKTNKEIVTENTYKKFALDPINHIPDISFYHYALQLNLYQYLLRYGKYVPHDAKFKLFLNHCNNNVLKLIELPDLQLEISHMIIHRLINMI